MQSVSTHITTPFICTPSGDFTHTVYVSCSSHARRHRQIKLVQQTPYGQRHLHLRQVLPETIPRPLQKRLGRVRPVVLGIAVPRVAATAPA